MHMPYIDSVKGQITPRKMDMSSTMVVSCISSSSNSQRKISSGSGSSGKSAGQGSVKSGNSSKKLNQIKIDPEIIKTIR